MMGRVCILMLWVAALNAASGCAPPPASEGGFDSRDPGAKLYAIHRAGEERDQTTIAPLIEQLNSDDPAVRMYAIAALEKITGQRMGYSPYAPAHERDPAVARWVAAYQTGQLGPPLSQHDQTGGGEP